MKTLYFSLLLVMIAGFSNCTTEVSCRDMAIRPVFIHFTPSDIDTLVLRKYKAGTNFQQGVDSVFLVEGRNVFY